MCCGQGVKTSGEVCVLWSGYEDFRCVCCGQGVKTSGEGCVLWSGYEDFR